MISYVSRTVFFFAISICSVLHSGDEKKNNKLLNIFCIENYFNYVVLGITYEPLSSQLAV